MGKNWDKPRTTWCEKEKRKQLSSPMPEWMTCAKCGKERFALPPKDGTEYICHICRETEGAASSAMPNEKAQQPSPSVAKEVVSMRCLRHKKRFNVPKEWLKTSQWLCPHCYSVLDETNRAKYAPKGGIPPEVRPAEDGKPVVVINSTRIKQPPKNEEPKCDAPNKTALTIEPEAVKPIPKKKKYIYEEQHYSKLADNPTFAGLLPRYRILCQKCGQSVPCHYTWFDTSTVLCPECYGQMGPTAISLFHDMHKAAKPKYVENVIPMQQTVPQVEIPVPEKKRGRPKLGMSADDKISALGGWSTERIREASKQELAEAVEQGEVSKARMRIELRRRASWEYFDMCPDPDAERQPPTFE